MKNYIGKVVQKTNLTETEAREAMMKIMGGEATDAQIASLITALRMKGETVEEITGFAKVMKNFATPITVQTRLDIDRDDINIDSETILDTCGTGGDGTNTFNISTATALVAASCGLTVAKHGNRSVSSACGSADVLEALGVNVNITPEKVEDCIKALGIGFLYAPALHGAMKHAINARRQIGIRTVFNILGPLTNPANATAQVLGVYSKQLVDLVANVLKNLGSKRAWVVHGRDGMDEISLSGPTYVADLKKGIINSFDITPEEFGLTRAELKEIKGGTAEENAVIIKRIFAGELGPKRDVVLLNAAAALLVGGKVVSLKEGMDMASQAIDSKSTLELLAKLVKRTNEIA